ncbi:MAG TPA: CehA/McbA family metallohydrolase [Vicinamibacterales bacterium]|nr:CehA/McbA family metallohydrolase [Vicinamibacterales bacterium]
MSSRRCLAAVVAVSGFQLVLALRAQEPAHPPPGVPLQPLAQQVRRLETGLRYLGQPLSRADHEAINEAVASSDEAAGVTRIQQVLDRHVLARVHINPESRVRVEQGTATPDLVQGGTRLFLVKVLNEGGVTAPITVASPNHGRVYVPSRNTPEVRQELTQADVRDRWAEIAIFSGPPMRPRLSGLGVEYVILQIYSRDAGQRSAILGFSVGQGSQDVGFRNDIEVLFTAKPAHPVRIRVFDEHGAPTTAAFLVRDGMQRVYPNISKRLAPDFFFQPQVYRSDGEVLQLPPGDFSITASRGPEYLEQSRAFAVSGPTELEFRLQRWIDPSQDGWYSGDHHIHSAGCSHYENPTEGVTPEQMWPQIAGEALNLASVLIWGPSYYHQKQFFTGRDHPLSTSTRLMRYDIEISGFPSSHAGHLVLLGLEDQDYPGTKRLEDWPSWTLPILRWAKAQGAVVGFAHSGWGLEVKSRDLPNYDLPGFDGIGANEYIVDVTHPGTVDFISAGDTPSIWELNIWYHTLNAGFRTRISGETDFPCITDDRVGIARSYAKLAGPLTYRGFIDAVAAGRSYVADGRSHLFDFTVDGMEAGTGASEVRLDGPRRVKVTVRAAARLDEVPNEAVRRKPYDETPYWDLERARIGNSREVPVEIVVNGSAVATQNLVADGTLRTLTFDVPIERSSWLAVRIFPSSHTNPVFALVGDQPIRASRRSAEWCLNAVNQCWSQKAPRIRPGELADARAAYEHARQVYRQRMAEAVADPPGEAPDAAGRAARQR